jgi:Flp pilus assembly pilin Flp
MNITRNVKRVLAAFWADEAGQDIIEYTLLLAFVALACAAIFLSTGGSVNGLWGTANNKLIQANTAAAGVP